MGPSSGQEEQWTNTSAAAADDVDNDGGGPGDWLTVMTKNGTDRLSFDGISDFLRGWNIVSNLFTKIYCKSFVNYFTCLHGCTVCHRYSYGHQCGCVTWWWWYRNRLRWNGALINIFKSVRFLKLRSSWDGSCHLLLVQLPCYLRICSIDEHTKYSGWNVRNFPLLYIVSGYIWWLPTPIRLDGILDLLSATTV